MFKVEVNLRGSELESLIAWSSLVASVCSGLRHRIDYGEFEANKKPPQEIEETRQEFDEVQSHSSISICKEYELVDDIELIESEHFTLSSDDLSSSSAASSRRVTKKRSSKINKTSEPNAPVVLIMREKTDDQVNLNFSLSLQISYLAINLVHDTKFQTNLILQRAITQIDINNIFQKFELRVKNFLALNENGSDNNLEKIIVSTETDLMNKNLYLEPGNSSTNDTSSSSVQNFIELTITRALMSNLSKKLDPQQIKFKPKIKAITNLPKWILEFNLTMNNLDFIFHLSKIEKIFNFISNFNRLLEINFNLTNRSNEGLHVQQSQLIPLIRASDVPLINIDLSKIRFIFPVLNQFKTPIIVAQVMNLKLTSQVDNPLIRNFSSSLASNTVYNKTKSDGSIYRPGFAFEDRQYLLDVSNVALFSSSLIDLEPNDQLKSIISPILRPVQFCSILGLPILLNDKLINGYCLELNIKSPQVYFYLSDFGLNLITGFIDENSKLIENLWAKKIEKNSTPVKTKPGTIEIVPVDVLLTLENLNLCLYSNKPILWLQLIQPHICIQMHERTQKFELSVFDCELRRSAANIWDRVIDETIVPTKNDFVYPILETKTGEKNPKTGILSGFFTVVVNNFAALFRDEIIDNNQVVVCACGKCNRCYEFKSNVKNVTNKRLKTEILVQRPLRIKVNLDLYDQIIQFCSKLDLLKEQNIVSLFRNFV